MRDSTAPTTFAPRLPSLDPPPEVAVLVPCYNEATTVARVIGDFRRSLPLATIYVCDNASTDQTASIAAASGAVVVRESKRGKGNAVRRLFAEVDADVYLLVDGDDTYDASAAPELVARLTDDRLDMVSGARELAEDAEYRRGHRFGAAAFTSVVSQVFNADIDDVLTGYRAMSRRFVKSFPAHASGFEIETELTVHALELRAPLAEISTHYQDRPAGSDSKLNTFRDGWRILRTIVVLAKDVRPFAFFGLVAVVLALVSLILAAPVVAEYYQTGLVPRLPTAVLSVAIMLVAAISLTCGIILDTVTRGRRELKRLLYLAVPRRGA